MNPAIEHHPFEPFLPEGAKMLMLGTFPPAEKRWSMPFYYPNFTNDMWRIVGYCFFDDKQHFVADDERHYRLDDLCTGIVKRYTMRYKKRLEIIQSIVPLIICHKEYSE